MNNSLLKYSVSSEEYKFFYRDEIIFGSTKNNPFLYLSIEKEGVKKLLPFNEFEIEKEDKNILEIKFFAISCVVKLKLVCDENNVYFSFEKVGRPDDRLYIRLYKKNTRTVGLGLNVKNDLDKERIGVLDRLKEKKKDKEYQNVDNTLNFYVVNGYYFSNENINDWEVAINGDFVVSSAQEKIKFRLEYNKRFSFLTQKSYKLLKTNIEEAEQKLESDYDGFVIKYNTDIKTPYKINKIRKTKSVFIYLSPVVKKEDFDFADYDEAGLIKINGGYLINKNDEHNYRVFKNRIRKLLNVNPDGIYVDEKEIKNDINLQLKNIVFYENLHSLINEITKEYTEKYIIYNKLNSSDIININDENKEAENKNSLIYSYKSNIKISKELYTINYEEINKKENLFINNLLFSGYKSYFYECNEADIEELQRQGKIQIIVDNNILSKNSKKRKKKLKNKHK